MSAAIVIADDLRERVVVEIRAMSAHHRSLAFTIKADTFAETVEETCRVIDLTIADIEIAVICALAKVREKRPSLFSRYVSNAEKYKNYFSLNEIEK